MGRPERTLDPQGSPLHRFAHDLRQLRVAAGKPSYRELSRRAHFSVTALSEAAAGEKLPSLAVTLAYVEACGGDRCAWEARWRALAAEAASGQPQEQDAPYLGLMTFRPEHAGLYFGRERLVAELCSRVADGSFLAVVGASGSGKSSLLNAGLLPAITAGVVPHGQQWPTTRFTPGRHPMEDLAVHLASLHEVPAGLLHQALVADPAAVRLTVRQVLAGRPEPARVLIMVDQLEEVFTLCQDERERRGFIDALLAAAREAAACVVVGVRADFYARLSEHAGMVAALRDGQVLVGPMGRGDLRRVVVGPAKAAGCRVEPQLVEAILVDACDQPGMLPLVSHVLLETWRRRRGDTLTVAGYLAAGGVQGAIAQTAEQVYGDLGAADQVLAKELFVRMTALGDGTEDTRRHPARGELVDGPHGPSVAAVLDRLIAARLVTSDRDTVTVAHEALLRNWPRLRSWLQEDRERLRLHRRLTEAAAEWQRYQRDDGLLYRGARLESWSGLEADLRLNDLEQAFLAASRERAARERERGRRRVRRALAAAVAVATVMVLLAGAALVQADRAAVQRDLAVSRQLAAEARNRLRLDPKLGLQLARRAVAASPTTEAEAVLRQALVDDRLLAVLPEGKRALGVTFSPDGRRLATSTGDGTIRVRQWAGDGVSPAGLVVLHGPRGEARSPAFSPDGRRLAVAAMDDTIRLFDLNDGSQTTLTGHQGPVWNVAFSPDGRRLASAGDDGTVRLWDLRRPRAARVRRGHRGPVVDVAFRPDGRALASSGHDRTVRLWDLTGRGSAVVLRGHEGAPKGLAFGPDGSWLASAAVDGTARVWSTAGGRARSVLRGHEGSVEDLAVSPDGRSLATASDDATIRVWNPSWNGDPLILRGHKGTVWQVTVSPQGRHLASASEDGTVRIWDLRGSGDPVTLGGHQGSAWEATFLPGGRRVASAGQDGTVRIWPVGVGRPEVLRGHDGEVMGLAVGPDGRTLASAGRDGTIRIWPVTGEDPLAMRGHRGTVWAVAFSPDGRRLASAGADGTLRIWDATDGRVLLVRHADGHFIRDVAFSPDGRRVATAGRDNTIRLWDATDGTRLEVLRGHHGLVWAVAFSPDGRRLASAGDDGTVRLWSLGTARPALVLTGHQGFVWYVAFSPDGQWLASAGHDNTVRIWPTVGAAEPVTVSGFGASVESLAFSPDSRRVLTAHGDGSVRLWSCVVCRPVGEVVRLADGQLAMLGR